MPNRRVYRDQHDIIKSSRMVHVIVGFIFVALAWAYFAKLTEVSNGTGKVIASSKEQVIQSLEGGVLAKILVTEGQTVKAGQVLAVLDPERIASNVDESQARLDAALAASARLEAEVNQRPLVFPKSLTDEELISNEKSLYASRRQALQQTLEGLERTRKLLQQELSITEPLVAKGAASDVEVIRLRRQLSELSMKMTDVKDQFAVKAREDLSKVQADVEALTQVVRGKSDALTRTTITSPVRGIVKNINNHTIGGVIPPNGEIMRIIPTDERLLVEAQISPRDIAYIHPGQAATVKITSYDYSIYGGLEGVVETISPDTIQDEVKRDQFYYRVYIRTNKEGLTAPDGRNLPITPGMVATVDIKTGEKTVLDYLIKPFNKAREALRER